MDNPVPAPPESPASAWGSVARGLLTPTAVTTVVGGLAAIGVGVSHTFDPQTSRDLVLLGIGMLTGMTINAHRAAP